MWSGTVYEWISHNDIITRVVPDLEMSNRLILRSFGLTVDADSSALKAADTDGASYRRYLLNEQAKWGWGNLTTYNTALKTSASEWTDFYSSLTRPGISGTSKTDPEDPAKTTLGKAATKTTDKLDSRAKTPSQPVDRLIQLSNDAVTASDFTSTDDKGLLSDSVIVPSNMTSKVRTVGSISYFGDVGGSVLSFALSSSSTSTSDRAIDATMHVGVGGGVDASHEVSAFVGAANFRAIKNMIIVHGNHKALDNNKVNTVTINLGDGDDGDLFHVQIKKDTVFGSPVYVTVSGQTRCPPEAGTVSREEMELIIGTPMFAHVHPKSAVSTGMTLINNSPTQEEFTVSFSVQQETNMNGLHLYVNGQVLTTSVTKLQFALGYGTNLAFTLVAERGEGSYLFDSIVVQVASQDDTGTCKPATATISVEYDTPCNAIAFAGPLAIAGKNTHNTHTHTSKQQIFFFLSLLPIFGFHFFLIDLLLCVCVCFCVCQVHLSRTTRIFSLLPVILL